MNQEMVSIFYYEKYGYIITSYTEFKNSGIPTAIEPAITLEIGVSALQLGEHIMSALEKSKEAVPIEKDGVERYKYWHVSGIKGFSAFSKKFTYVKVLGHEADYEILKMDRVNNGGYVISKNENPIKFFRGVHSEQLGRLVLSFLESNVECPDNMNKTFITLHEKVVSFIEPSEDFIDIGDGHTDAYQIYVYEKDDRNYIAFLIDNGYSEFTEDAIRYRWEQMYGEFIEFKYKEMNGQSLIMRIDGRTQTNLITSYVYKDNNDFIEVLTEINLSNTTLEEQKKIKEEFEKVIGSIKIV